MPRLIFEDPQSGQEVSVDIGPELSDVTIGRSPGNVVRINQPSVSREHAEIIYDNGQCTIRDLDSSNGTYINGTPIQNQVLRDGDRVQVGDFPLDYVEPWEEAQQEAEQNAPDAEFGGRQQRDSHPSAPAQSGFGQGGGQQGGPQQGSPRQSHPSSQQPQQDGFAQSQGGSHQPDFGESGGFDNAPSEPGGRSQPSGGQQPQQPGGAPQPHQQGGAQQPSQQGGAPQPQQPAGAPQQPSQQQGGFGEPNPQNQQQGGDAAAHQPGQQPGGIGEPS